MSCTPLRITGIAALAACLYVAPLTAAAVPIPYEVIDLGVIVANERGNSSYANAVSADGRYIAGEATAVESSSFMINHATRWDDGQPRDLGVLPGWAYSRANGVNVGGAVVGDCWSAAGSRAFLYDGSNMRDIGSFGGNFTVAYDINASGTVVGYSDHATAGRRAFIYRDDQMTELGVLPGATASIALAINSADEAVGFSFGRAVLFKDSAVTELGTLEPGGSSRATDINDLGVAVGDASMEGERHAVRFSGAAPSDLGQFGGMNTYPEAINNLGQIVGYAGLQPGGNAWLWEDGEFYRLNDLINTSGWDIWEANDINDLGWIVGTGMSPGRRVRAVLLRPVPEPATPGAVFALLAVTAFRRARRI